MEAVLDLLHQTMSSPWIYLALFGIAVLDGFFPVVPSETAVITAGVFAATGTPDLAPVVAAAAAGAFTGDHISYAIGRSLKLRRRRKALEWGRQALATRGGLALVVARYIPGGRTAVTMTCGATRYPLRTFSRFAGLAALTWALYSALVGYVGGMAFEQDPVKGLLFGLGFALTIAAVVELVRWRRRPRVRDARESSPSSR